MILFIISLALLISKVFIDALSKISFVASLPAIGNYIVIISKIWYLYPISVAGIVYGLTNKIEYAVITSTALSFVFVLGGLI